MSHLDLRRARHQLRVWRGMCIVQSTRPPGLLEAEFFQFEPVSILRGKNLISSLRYSALRARQAPVCAACRLCVEPHLQLAARGGRRAERRPKPSRPHALARALRASFRPVTRAIRRFSCRLHGCGQGWAVVVAESCCRRRRGSKPLDPHPLGPTNARRPRSSCPMMKSSWWVSGS